MMIIFCQGTYGERMWQTKECVKRIRPFVDRAVIICDETVSEEDLDWLKDKQCEVYVYPWNDNFPEMRNHYLDKCQDGDWVIVSDPDEWFCKDFCNDLRSIVAEAQNDNITLLGINSRDVMHESNDDRYSEENAVKSNFYKNLIFRFVHGTRYEGCGKSANVHEVLLLKGAHRNLPDKYYYTHHKYPWEVWERAMRNVYIGGGGNNMGDGNPQWTRLKSITSKLGLHSWREVRDYMRKGNIDDSLKQWLIDNRRDGFDYEHEMMEGFRWYFEYLHPEENTDGLEVLPSNNTRAKTMRVVEESYLRLLGRHASQMEKERYVDLISNGSLSVSDLAVVLTTTPEYIRKSWIPSLKQKWEAIFSITKKAETDGKGDDDSSIDGIYPFVRIFEKYCPPADYRYILDIGAGAGLETKILSEVGYIPVGITFGRDNIIMGRKKYDVLLMEMDMHDLRFQRNTFDAIFSLQSFEHAFSPWFVILEMRRVLRDGGRVFLDLPDPEDEPMLNTIWHTSVLYPNQLKALFKKAGFSLVVDLSRRHRLDLVFEKTPDGMFESWEYVKHIVARMR